MVKMAVFNARLGLVVIAGMTDLYYYNSSISFEPVHEISNNVVCATSKASDQPAICIVWSEPLLVA